MNALHGKVAIVTGGTGGIGLHTAIGLARAGARVVVTGRSEERGREAVTAIARASGRDNVTLALGDLSLVSGVRALARRLLADHGAIHVLVHNAGHLAGAFERTADGLEIHFAVNVVTPWLLTHELMASLVAGAPARIVHVTGGMPFGGLDPTNLQAEHGFRGLATYSHAKRAMEAMAMALAREIDGTGVSAHVVYPGSAHTAMTGAMTPGMLPLGMRLLWPIFKLVMRPDGGKGAERASRSSVWAATTPTLPNGSYHDTACKPARLHATVLDRDLQEAVLAAIGNAVSRRPRAAGEANALHPPRA